MDDKGRSSSNTVELFTAAVCRFVSVADLWEPTDDGTASQVCIPFCFCNKTGPSGFKCL